MIYDVCFVGTLMLILLQFSNQTGLINFSCFSFEMFLLHISFYNAVDIMAYILQNVNVDCEKKKLNRFAHNVLRRSLL